MGVLPCGDIYVDDSIRTTVHRGMQSYNHKVFDVSVRLNKFIYLSDERKCRE